MNRLMVGKVLTWGTCILVQTNTKQAIKRKFDVNRSYVKTRKLRKYGKQRLLLNTIVNITVAFCPVENFCFIGAME